MSADLDLYEPAPDDARDLGPVPDETATAETALVGIAMHDAAAIDDAHLTPDDFRDVRLGALWSLMTTQRRGGAPTDPATLASMLGRLLPVRVEATMLADLYGDAPVTALGEHYARIVADKATLRRLDAAARRIAQLVQEDPDAAEAVEVARAEVDACTRSTASLGLMAADLDVTLERLERPGEAIPTPWADLNHLIGGWRPGALYVIGARPGVGKTIVGVQAAVGLAAHGYVALSSLEMSRHEVHERILAATARVPMSHMAARELTDGDWASIASHRAALADLRLSIDDRATATPTDVRSHARSLSRLGPLAGIVVDYLQLMGTPRGDRRPRHEVVAELSRSLKVLAKDQNTPVLALSQLNRASEARVDRRPTMADLRESGGLEQDADVVLLLHVEENDPSTLHVAVAKNRHGPTGGLRLTRRGEYARVDDQAWRPA